MSHNLLTSNIVSIAGTLSVTGFELIPLRPWLASGGYINRETFMVEPISFMHPMGNVRGRGSLSRTLLPSHHPSDSISC